MTGWERICKVPITLIHSKESISCKTKMVFYGGYFYK